MYAHEHFLTHLLELKGWFFTRISVKEVWYISPKSPLLSWKESCSRAGIRPLLDCVKLLYVRRASFRWLFQGFLGVRIWVRSWSSYRVFEESSVTSISQGPVFKSYLKTRNSHIYWISPFTHHHPAFHSTQDWGDHSTRLSASMGLFVNLVPDVCLILGAQRF